MSTDDNEQKAARPRKVQRSISTADRAGFQPTEPRPEGEVVKWDMRAERPAPAPGEAPPPSARPRRRPPSGDFRPRRDDGDAPRRPGASGGRAMPEMPQRGPVDRSSADFVDRWLSQKPRPPQGPREGGPGRPEGRGEGRPDRRPRRDGAGPRPDAQARSAAPRTDAPRREEPKKQLPSLHETILIGLPRVSEEGRAAAQQNKPKTAREAIAAKTQKVQAPEPKQEKAAARAVDPTWTTATAETAVASLRAAQDLADKVVDAWLAQNNVAAIAEAGQSEDLSGPARKASRRALSVLKARGVAIPAPAAKTPKAGAIATGREEVVEATFTSPDSRGTSSYTIAVRQGTDRAHIAEVIVRDEVGVIQAVSGWMSRSQIKEAHQRVAEGSGLTPVAVPADWVRHRVAEAKKKNQTSQVLVPLSIEKCKEIIEPAPAAAPAHPVADLEAGLDDAAAASGSLHSEPEFRAWLPESQALDELVRKVGQALTQEEAQDPKKVDEVLKEEIKSATDRFFTPEVRDRLAERMRDAAISVRARAGDDRARDVLRTARAIKSAGLITSPPHEIEFLESFFQKGVAVMAQRGGGSVRVPTRA